MELHRTSQAPGQEGASTYDTLIVGGGLVGASLALALAQIGLRVCVVEASAAREASPPSFDDRTLALGAASCGILRGLGLWEALEDSATPIRQVIVSELDRPGRVNLDAAESGRDSFGHVVEARAFGAVVLQRLAAEDAVTMRWETRVTGVQPPTEDPPDPREQQYRPADRQPVLVEVDGANGPEVLRAPLLVAADGTDSLVRNALGIDARQKDYGQTAVICNVVPEERHRDRAFERMTPTGPFALLPHVGERCGLVWCAPSDEAATLLALSDEEFLARATERSGAVLGRLQRAGRRSAYPLRLLLPEADVVGRVVVLGNAAHAIHPAGAQGFNLGLRDVAVLAEVLAADGHPPADPGAPELLAEYARWRRPDREATVAWTDGLVSLFGSERLLVRALRSVGLLAHALAPPLRRRMASEAMGFRGRVPRLAGGEPLQ
jgi:2-octaprenyl-6-methoxyphenol hydroxylase